MRKILPVLAMFLGLCTISVSLYGQQPGNVKAADYPHLDLVYRAAKVIDSATDVSVTYLRYSELVQNLATEISIAGDQVDSEKEQKLLQRFRTVLVFYQKALESWGEYVRSRYSNWVDAAQNSNMLSVIWHNAAEELKIAILYYSGDTKKIAEYEAWNTLTPAEQDKILWVKEVNEYVDNYPYPDLRDALKKECFELGPNAWVRYRKGEYVYYPVDLSVCHDLPKNFVEKAKEPSLKNAIVLSHAIERGLIRWPNCKFSEK